MAIPDPLLLPNKTGDLSMAEQITVSQLLAQHITVPQIAAQLRRTPEAIYRTCHEARAWLEGCALDAAIDWQQASKVAAAKGDHRPAKDLLQAVRVVDAPTSGASGAQVVVQLGFALPGLPKPVND